MNDPKDITPKRKLPINLEPYRAGLRSFLNLRVIGPILILFLFLGLSLFIWYECRIEPGPDQIAILIRKTGDDLPSGQLLATSPGQKGIQPEVLPEGRYFYNPYSWDWRLWRVTDIQPGKLGVQTRLYGKDLAPGQIIAAPGGKGIVAEVLRPGKHRINPYAYRIELFDAITIHPGHVGVVTSLVGRDVLNTQLPPERRNTFLAAEEMKGVTPQVLDPGTYYLNPYLVSVVEISLQSQRFAMSGDDAINFLTQDGFTVHVEGTVEFSLQRDKVALITHRIGDMEDVLKKVILPKARGFSRIEGSKHPAINFIVGETRQQFQNNLETHLRQVAAEWGVNIRSVLIRNIQPPDAIASVIRDREVSVQNARKFEQQIEQARSKAELTRQEMLAVQNKEKVESETARIQAIIRAEQDLAVRLTAAQRELAVAQLERDAAEAQAQAMLAKAQADRDVIAMENQATATVLAAQVKAFPSGMDLARYSFYQKIGPSIGSVLSSDQEGGLGVLFRPYLPRAEAKP